jgi:hypothetical protein
VLPPCYPAWVTPPLHPHNSALKAVFLAIDHVMANQMLGSQPLTAAVSAADILGAIAGIIGMRYGPCTDTDCAAAV